MKLRSETADLIAPYYASINWRSSGVVLATTTKDAVQTATA